MSRATLRGWLMLAPALVIVGGLFGASLWYSVLQSLGYLPFIGQFQISLDAYRNLMPASGTPASREFLPALGFTLWVSGAATLLAAAGALGVVAVGLGSTRSPQAPRGIVPLLNLTLAFPHLVWAVAIALLLAQSGFIARVLFLLGIITTPADFPVLIRDPYGIGIIISYTTKLIPFLLLMLLATLHAQTDDYAAAAATLGASRWQTLRYVTLPLVLPALTAGMLLGFGFVFGAYEVPALLGVQFPRMLAVLALDFFRNADLRSRAEGMAISVLTGAIVLLVAAVAYALTARRTVGHG